MRGRAVRGRLIVGRIVPVLPFTRAEQIVECCAQHIHAGRNEEYFLPLAHRWLPIEIQMPVRVHVGNVLIDKAKLQTLTKNAAPLTFPSIKKPATIGANKPAKFAVQFVKAIKMPANRGVISKWLILKPE